MMAIKEGMPTTRATAAERIPVAILRNPRRDARGPPESRRAAASSSTTFRLGTIRLIRNNVPGVRSVCRLEEFEDPPLLFTRQRDAHSHVLNGDRPLGIAVFRRRSEIVASPTPLTPHLPAGR